MPVSERRFRKRPVEVEAVRWTGRNQQEIHDFTDGIARFVHDLRYGSDLSIPTMEGRMDASPGDWIIRGVAGEFYPCKPDIFEATYEPVCICPPDLLARGGFKGRCPIHGGG